MMNAFMAHDDYDLNLRKSLSVQPVTSKLIVGDYSSGPISIDDQEGMLVNDPILEVVGHSIYKVNQNFTEDEIEFSKF